MAASLLLTPGVASQDCLDGMNRQPPRELRMEGLMHEVQILSKINHPSLLQLVGASLDISSPMMLTELMLKQDVECLY